MTRMSVTTASNRITVEVSKWASTPWCASAVPVDAIRSSESVERYMNELLSGGPGRAAAQPDSVFTLKPGSSIYS